MPHRRAGFCVWEEIHQSFVHHQPERGAPRQGIALVNRRASAMCPLAQKVRRSGRFIDEEKPGLTVIDEVMFKPTRYGERLKAVR